MPVPVLTAAPADDLVTREELKLHLKVDGSDDDALIDTLVSAVAARLDGWSGVLGRCLLTQTWRQDFACWPADGCLRLPFPDVQSVTVTYYDENEAEQTVSSALYELLEDARGAYVKFKSAFTSPTLDDDRSFPVSVSLVAGYGNAASNVPAPIRVGALMTAAHLYQNRGDMPQGGPVTLTGMTETLIAPYRRVGFGG